MLTRRQVVQYGSLHVTDVQNPLRFEYLDRRCRTGHRPQELLGSQGAAALVRRVNSLRGGPITGRPLDAGDHHGRQHRQPVWARARVAAHRSRRGAGASLQRRPRRLRGCRGCRARGVLAARGRQPGRFEGTGFPRVPGLLAAATAPFRSPGLDVPWLMTMGNHDGAALGTLDDRRAPDGRPGRNRASSGRRHDALHGWTLA